MDKLNKQEGLKKIGLLPISNAELIQGLLNTFLDRAKRYGLDAGQFVNLIQSASLPHQIDLLLVNFAEDLDLFPRPGQRFEIYEAPRVINQKERTMGYCFQLLDIGFQKTLDDAHAAAKRLGNFKLLKGKVVDQFVKRYPCPSKDNPRPVIFGGDVWRDEVWGPVGPFFIEPHDTGWVVENWHLAPGSKDRYNFDENCLWAVVDEDFSA